jgi:polar amino acid transport system substrate-binding protein
MRCWAGTLAGAIFVVLASTLPAAAGPGDATGCATLTLSGDPDFKPFSWSDNGTMRGAAFDIAIAALRQINQPYQLRDAGPFSRVLADAEAGRVDVVVELKRLPEREAYLDFTRTPIFVNPVSAFTRRGVQLDAAHWDSLIGLRGGIVLGNRFGGGLDEFLAEKAGLEEVPRLELGFAMLEIGRLDYFITAYYPGRSWLQDHGRAAVIEIHQPDLVATENYAGFSRASPCHTRLAAFDQALAQLARSGQLQKLRDREIGRWQDGSYAGR